MWNHTIGILIGGESRRMGTPKHQIELPCGKTMLELVLEFANGTATRTIFVGGDHEGYMSVHDQRNAQGPVAGIEALLGSGIDSRYLFVGCDMPLLTTNNVKPLLETKHAASAFSHEETIIGLPLMLSASTLKNCTKYLDSGRRSIKGFITSIEHSLLPVDSEMAVSLTSVNTPDDLNKLSFE